MGPASGDPSRAGSHRDLLQQNRYSSISRYQSYGEGFEASWERDRDLGQRGVARGTLTLRVNSNAWRGGGGRDRPLPPALTFQIFIIIFKTAPCPPWSFLVFPVDRKTAMKRSLPNCAEPVLAIPSGWLTAQRSPFPLQPQKGKASRHVPS